MRAQAKRRTHQRARMRPGTEQPAAPDLIDAICPEDKPVPLAAVSCLPQPRATLRTPAPVGSGSAWLSHAVTHREPAPAGRAGRGGACRTCTVGLRSGTQAGRTCRSPRDSPRLGETSHPSQELGRALLPLALGSPKEGGFEGRAAPSPDPQMAPGDRGHLSGSRDPV